MKIRFWTKAHSTILLIISIVPIFSIIGTYVNGGQTDFTVFLLGFLILCVYFLPHYFRYLLVLSDSDLLIREGVFERGVSINTVNIKSIVSSELNNEPTSINFELYEGKTINWHTKNRTTELYQMLISVNPEWQK